MTQTDHEHSFHFEQAPRETAALSALVAQMFDSVAQEHAGARTVRPASIHMDFTSRKADGPLVGRALITKSTASVLFLSAELTENGTSVLRASALYGFADD